MDRVYVLFTDTDFDMGEVLKKLPRFRLERVQHIKNREQKKQSVLSSLLLRYAFLDAFGVDVFDFEVVYTEKGKPRFLEKDNLYFNLAHTNGAAVCIVSDTECGIDVEQACRKISEAVQERFLGKVYSSSKEAICEWVKKESYGKFTGEGLICDVQEKEVQFGFFDVSDDVGNSYKGCICKRTFVTPLKTQIKTLSEIFDKLK